MNVHKHVCNPLPYPMHVGHPPRRHPAQTRHSIDVRLPCIPCSQILPQAAPSLPETLTPTSLTSIISLQMLQPYFRNQLGFHPLPRFCHSEVATLFPKLRNHLVATSIRDLFQACFQEKGKNQLIKCHTKTPNSDNPRLIHNKTSKMWHACQVQEPAMSVFTQRTQCLEEGHRKEASRLMWLHFAYLTIRTSPVFTQMQAVSRIYPWDQWSSALAAYEGDSPGMLLKLSHVQTLL